MKQEIISYLKESASTEFLESLMRYKEEVEDLERAKDIRDTVLYKNLLSRYQVPDSMTLLSTDNISHYLYDDDLLLRLILASNASTSRIFLAESWKSSPSERILIDVEIRVVSEGREASRRLSELWIFQIEKLYCIYLTEMMERILHEPEFGVKGFKVSSSHSELLEHEERCNRWLEAIVSESKMYRLLAE